MMKSLRFLLMGMMVMLTGQAFAEDIIWQEDFSGFANGEVPADGDNSYACVGSGTKIYTQNLAGGESPELLVGKSGGSFSAKIKLNGKSGDMMLTFKCNKNISVLCHELFANRSDYFPSSSNTGNDYSYPFTVPAGTDEITITFKQESSDNARLDNIKVYQGEAKKAAGLSWGKASTTLTIGKEITLSLSNENQLPVVFTSSNDSVATISNVGVITLLKPGTTIFTAAFAGNDEYEAQNVAVTVTVKAEASDSTGTNKPDSIGKDSIAVKMATIAEFKAAAESDSVWYLLTGTVKNLKDNDQYGNFDLFDETDTVYVFGLLSEKGGEKKKFQELAAAKGIKNGSVLTLIGTRGSYNGKIEVMNAYFVSVEAGDSTSTPIETKVDTINVAKALELAGSLASNSYSGTEYVVKGYVVAAPSWKPYVKDSVIQNYNVQFKLSDQLGDSINALLVYNPKNLNNEYFPEKYDGLYAGSVVVLKGQLQNYKGTTLELAKCYFLSINGVTAISEMKATRPQDDRIFNLSGQRVAIMKKGLYIKNGRKYLAK
jgi:hypothetical protein